MTMHNPKPTKAVLLQCLCIALCIGGCASVDVQYVKPGDTTTHGFRYYLPRPFVAVKKPFPVEYHEAYVPGTVKDERIEVTLDNANSTLYGLNTTGANVWYIDFPKISVSDSLQQQTADANSASGKGVKGKDEEADNDQDNSDTSKEDEQETEPAAAAAGPSAVPLNEFFDVLYLPDYNQQYAIKFETGLGKATQTIKLQHGWMLTDYSGETDNTEVLSSIGSFIGSAVSSLAGFAAIGAQPAAVEPEPAAEEESEESLHPSTPKKLLAPEDKVLIKIMVIRNALPGTYPVLKPSEISQYKSPAGNSNLALVPNPNEVENAPFAVLYATELVARFELVSIQRSPKPEQPK